MPTTVRILILRKGRTPIYGKAAIIELQNAVKPYLLSGNKWPEDWSQKTKLQRIEFLGRFLHRDNELQLIREPKHLRKNKSLSLRLIKIAKQAARPEEDE